MSRHELFTDIICKFEMLNGYMVYIIGFLLNNRELSEELFSEYNFRHKQEVFKKLCKGKTINEDLKNKFTQLYNKISDCSKKRNEVAHSMFLADTRTMTRDNIWNLKSDRELNIKVLREYDKLINNTIEEVINLIF